MAMHWTSRRTDSRGFTLVELMVVIVIASILMAIAIPSYRNSIRKSRRTDAKTALLDLAGREERYNSTVGGYTTAAANLGYGALPSLVGSNYYNINVTTVTAGTATTVPFFSLTATPVVGSDQAKDTACGAFTLTSTGAQTVSGTATDCW
jgi:type IV pilus assembly protein PilE